ncbi:PEP-utilizing enzyme [Patescibacteria group bacterium]
MALDQEFLQIFDKFKARKDWYQKAYQVRFFPWVVQVTGVKKMMERFPWSLQLGITIGEPNDLHTWMWNISDMERARDAFIDKVLDDPDFIKGFEKGFFRAWDAFLAGEKKYIGEQLAAEDVMAKLPAMYELCDLESEVGSFGYVNDSFLTAGGEDWIVAWISKELPDNVENREKVIADLATPVTASFVQEEEMDRLGIAAQEQAFWPGLLDEHVKKWHWVENSYIESEPLKAEDFKNKIEKQLEKVGGAEAVVKKLEQARQAAGKKAERKKELIEQCGFSDNLQKILDMSDRLSHLTDLRKMGVLRINNLIWLFLDDLARATGQPAELLYWMHYREMEDIVGNKKWDVLKERDEKGILVLSDKGKQYFVQGDDLKALDFSSFLEVDKSVTSLHGQVAFKGKVKGEARVVRGRKDFDRFQDGDILITNQTTPEFVPLMKRAAAVVTEQGGITCHAAIVSRELKIPCIIGTQSAMKIFKDGETIVVDGETGEVRKA